MRLQLKIYFLLFHFLPALILPFIYVPDYNLSNYHRTFILSIVAYVFLRFFKVRVWLPSSRFLTLRYFNNYFVILLYTFCATYYFNKVGITFRHSGSGLSSGLFLILATSLKEIYKYVLLFYFLGSFNGLVCESGKSKVFLITLGNVLMLSGSLDVLWITLGIILIAMPYAFHRRMYVLQIVLYLLLGIAVLMGVVFVGFANKLGAVDAVNFIQNNAEYIAAILLGRLSTLHISLMHVFEVSQFDFLTVLQREIHTSIDNLSVLFGKVKYRLEDPWSVNRLNWNLISSVFREKTGASPGLFASFYFNPFLFLAVWMFICELIRRLVIIIPKGVNQFVPIIFFLFITYPLIISPWSMLNIFSPSGLMCFLFLVLLNDLERAKI